MRKKSVGSSNDHSKVSRQTVYQRGSQRDCSPHYVFLYSDDEDSDQAQEDIPLELASSSKAATRKVEVIKVLLKPEDTLQALALRYRCTISDLKRINAIHKENEIFAHRYIKVPVQPFSIFTENLVNHDSTSSSSQNRDINSQSCETSESREEESTNLVESLPIATSSMAPQKININDIILNSICEPLTQFADCQSVSAAECEGTESEELISSEERRHSSTSQSNSTIDTFKCSGADWGLSWAHLLGVSLLLGFAGPLIYILYIAEDSIDNHSPKST